MNKIIILPEKVSSKNVLEYYNNALRIMKKSKTSVHVQLDFLHVNHIDSSGVVVANQIKAKASEMNHSVEFINLSAEIEKTFKLFKIDKLDTPLKKEKKAYFENIGHGIYLKYLFLKDFFVLLADIFFFAFVDLFKKKQRRKGEVVKQSIFIGVNALPIVSLIAFLVGFILALQSANQLRQFGANIFVADLVAVAMVSEMGPLITAIIIAGRSGSSIAAEIATMKVTEEVDGLKTMGIDPIPYLFVPKLYAISIVMPMLVIIANFIGIFGGAVIGLFYLDIGFVPFYNEVFTVLRYKEILVALIKSYVFAVLIVVTAIHFGMRAFGGPERVGKATTDSVVASIFFVILADTIIGLIFYFN